MSFIPAAEAALSGRPLPDASVPIDVVPREPPPVLDAEGLRALSAPLFASFMWGAAHFRTLVAEGPLDALALLLRVLALALTVRALLGVGLLLRRLRVRLAQDRYGLALGDEGLLYRTPEGDFVVLRQDIVDIRERGDWRGKGGRRWADVYLITRPDSGRVHLALPPVFLHTPGMLAEHLMRWLGQKATSAFEGDAQPADLPSKLWDRIATGERPHGVAVIGHGRGWLARGPYVSVLVGVAALDGYARLSEPMRAAIGLRGPLLLALVLVGVPLSWILLTRAQLAPRRGIALVLTPAELLFRTRAGVTKVAWKSIARVEVAARTTWSALTGAHESRTLVLHRKADDDVLYAEAFLGLPAEVVAGLCDAYRRSSATASTSPAGEPESTPAS